MNQADSNRRAIADNSSSARPCAGTAVIPAVYHPYNMTVHSPILGLVNALDEDLQESNDGKVRVLTRLKRSSIPDRKCNQRG